MFKEIRNDTKFVFKTLVNNIGIFFIILFLQIFLRVIISEHFNLGHVISNIQDNLGSMLLYICKILLIPNIILIAVYSGVHELSKKIINKEKVNFRTFIIGIRKHCIKITLLIIIFNTVYWVISNIVMEKVPTVIGKYIILDTISFINVFLVLYIVLIIMNSEISTIFINLKKILFSSKFVQIIIQITMLNLILITPCYWQVFLEKFWQIILPNIFPFFYVKI